MRLLRRLANVVAVALMATMFLSFLLQIFFRYVLNSPLGWTEEVTVLCWVWVVLWCAAFVLSDREEVRFDIVYAAVPHRARRAFALVASVAFVVLLAWSLPATWKYVTFMKVESTSYLKIRLDFLYSVYLFFAAAVIVRYSWSLWRMLRGGGPEAIDVTKTTSGL